MKKVGVVGCGTIGIQICLALDQGKIGAKLWAVADIDEQKAKQVVNGLKHACRILSLAELVLEVDLVVESAVQGVVPLLIEQVLDQGKDVLIMSVGALLQLDSLKERFQEAGSRLYVPSGAIAGLDAVKAACLVGVTSVTLTTRKPPKGFQGSPYCVQKGIDLEAMKEETLIYEGPALEAAALFPKNINVAASLSLAGLGPDKTLVRIIADPKTTTNSHQIEVIGESGKIVTQTINVPSSFNPKTSFLAALSGIATLKGIFEPIKIGT